MTATAGVQNRIGMNAKHAKSANTAEPPKPKKQAGVSTPDGERAASLNDLGPDIANALREIEVAAEDQFDRWEHFVSLDNRSEKEQAKIRQLYDKQRKLRARKRDLSPLDAARLSALLNEPEIAELEQEMHSSSNPYEKRLAKHWRALTGQNFIDEAVKDLLFTPAELREFNELMQEEARRSLEARRGEPYRPLLPGQKCRLRELDVRTYRIPLIFLQLRNAFLCDGRADEIASLVQEAIHVARGWGGVEALTAMRVLKAVGKLSAGCESLRVESEGEAARETVRKIIALEMWSDEALHRKGGLYEFWNEQLNTVYDERLAYHRSKASWVEMDRKMVERERKKALKENSPDK